MTEARKDKIAGVAVAVIGGVIYGYTALLILDLFK